MSYAIYLRKSRADAEAEARGEGETLARHEHILTEFARRANYPVGRVYREIVSGESIAARPQMQLLLADVEAGRWEGVIVTEIERLARGDSIDQGIMQQVFALSNTRVITPNKTYDLRNDSDETFMEFGLFMSRQEYKTIRRRLSAGREASAREGHYIGSRAPYGYDRVRKDGEWTLAINEEEAKIVRQIYAWYLSGDGGQKIATRLNSMGTPSPYGAKWLQSVVAKLIKNPVYIGRITWNKKTKTAVSVNAYGRKEYKRILNPNATNVQGIHPPIVDLETFEAVNHAFRAHPPVRSDQHIANPLAGMVRCGVCGASMRGLMGGKRPDGTRYPYRIKCPTVGCSTFGIAVDELEALILDTVSQWPARYAQTPDQRQPDPNALEIDQTRKQIDQLRAQQSRLCDLLERGIYSEDTYAERSVKLSDGLKRAKARLHELESAAPQTSVEDMIRAIIPQIPSAIRAYRNADTPEIKNVILKQFVDHIDYHKTKRCNRNESPTDYLTIFIYPSVSSLRK